jgi:hypothetical protein
MPHKVFWLEPTHFDRIVLRRYKGSYDGGSCPLPWGYHDAEAVWQPQVERDPDKRTEFEGGSFSAVPHDDPTWPTHCKCGYAFKEEDHWQTNHQRLYRSSLDGTLMTLREAPTGAMWDAWWYRDREAQHDWATGPDGICLIVKLPNGSDWLVDQEASNCTRTQWHSYTDEEGRQYRKWTGRTHYCWVRHGDPRTGDLHVDKNGDTCAAGAGSILSGSYHGFLHNGYLTD